jgi:Domain of unknown function (DUF6487)
MKCPKCDNDLVQGRLEFQKPIWLAMTWFARLHCCFWGEGFGERKLFWTNEDPPAWYCEDCRLVVVDGQHA